MKAAVKFAKKEFVLVIASLLAGLSMLLTPPSKAYFAYVDFAVLAILFCLMAVVAGLNKAGLFNFLSIKILQKSTSTKGISIVLVLACFFSSMFITNDVALITFVPLAIAVLHSTSQKQLVFVVVMQTVAANLGSMLTPIGNPQNLYIYSYYKLNIMQFLQAVLPLCTFSLVLITAVLFMFKGSAISVKSKEKIIVNKKALTIYFLLFFACALTVLHVISYIACFVLTIVVIIIADCKILKAIDYALLLTFVAFFIFVGNISAVPEIQKFLQQVISGRELFAGIAASQIVSNVPAAIMLSGFTQNFKELLLGVNIGGLGTIIASLASLISYKLYAKSTGARPMLFIGVFSIINLSFLGMCVLFALIA